MIGLQTEFPLTVAVCAWCKPQFKGQAGTLSHGICLKHLRKLKLQARGLETKRVRRTRTHSPDELPVLFYS